MEDQEADDALTIAEAIETFLKQYFSEVKCDQCTPNAVFTVFAPMGCPAANIYLNNDGRTLLLYRCVPTPSSLQQGRDRPITLLLSDPASLDIARKTIKEWVKVTDEYVQDIERYKTKNNKT